MTRSCAKPTSLEGWLLRGTSKTKNSDVLVVNTIFFFHFQCISLNRPARQILYHVTKSCKWLTDIIGVYS